MNITNIVDIIIVLTVALWGLYGFKRGLVKQGVMTIGTVLMFIIAFYLKNPVAEFLSLHLPFIKIPGLLGIEALNILFYQIISFIIVVSILEIVLNLLIRLSGIIETLLKFTIILGLPSKILGFALGVVEAIVIVYIVLVFLSQPMFNLKVIDNSSLAPKILNNIPGLSNVASGMVETFTDVYELTDKYSRTNDSDGYTRDAIDIMLKHKVIDVEYVEKLVEKNKVTADGINNVIKKYNKLELIMY